MKDISDSIQNEVFQDVNAHKTKILSSFSHELRTPLNGAISPLQLAMKDPAIPQEIKENKIKNSLLSLFILKNILNGIVDLSLFMSNQFELIISHLNLGELFGEIKEIIEKQTQFKEIEFILEIIDIPKYFHTDKKRLKQILLNLLSNSIKYTNKGTIILKVERKNQNELIFLVKDTGIGMNKKKLKQLEYLFKNSAFNSHHQLQNHPEQTSYCLGLLISQNIVLELGNKEFQGIQIKSKVNEGSEFTFSIESKFNQDESELSEDCYYYPIGNIREQPIHTNPLLPCSTEIKLKKSIKEAIIEEYILIVDDDCFNLMALEINLKQLGKKVLKAFNGQEAIDLLLNFYSYSENKKEIVFIFMDYQMPVLNGIQATIQIQKYIKQNILPNIPISACTAYGAKEQLQQCLEAGMIDYLIKPITSQCLEEFFRKWNLL